MGIERQRVEVEVGYGYYYRDKKGIMHYYAVVVVDDGHECWQLSRVVAANQRLNRPVFGKHAFAFVVD